MYREPPPGLEPRVLIVVGRDYGRFMVGGIVIVLLAIGGAATVLARIAEDRIGGALFLAAGLTIFLMGLPYWFQRNKLVAFDDDDVLQITLTRRWPLRRQSFTVPLSSAHYVDERRRGFSYLKLKPNAKVGPTKLPLLVCATSRQVDAIKAFLRCR